MVACCFGYSLFYTFTIGFNDDSDEVTCGWLEFLIRGDRGSGMDMLQSSDPRMKTLQENSILSFNAAFKVSHESLFWGSKSSIVEMSKTSLQRREVSLLFSMVGLFFYFFFQFVIGMNFDRYILKISIISIIL